MISDEQDHSPAQRRTGQDPESARVFWESILAEAREALGESWPLDLSPKKDPAEFHAALAEYRAEMKKHGIVLEPRTTPKKRPESA